ncbi:hypothetical protein ACP4OV_009649 [Aristida adscensionis]
MRTVVACIVVDAHWLMMVEMMATWLNLPTHALHTGRGVAYFVGFLAYPMLCEKGYLPVQL